MKAIVLKNFGASDNFELIEVKSPSMSQSQVLVKIKAIAFNPIDYQMRQGSPEAKLLKSMILGREMAGEIIKIGANVTNFKVGDSVAAYVGSLGSNGTYAQLIVVPVQLLAKIPKNITFHQAAQHYQWWG